MSLKTLRCTVPETVEIVIVANNRNNDELNLSVDIPGISVIKISRDLLYSEAANIGVGEAKGKIVTLCDQDLFYETGWYENLLRLFLSSDDIGAVGAKLLNPKNDRIIDFGIAYSPQTIVHPTRGLLHNHPWTGMSRQVSSACGAILMTEKETYFRCGGMDKTMPYICCDCDFGIQLLKLGKQVWVAADSIVYHIGSSSSLNTKISTYSYMRGDSKAMFYAKDYQDIPFDIVQWMRFSLSGFQETHPMAKRYYIYDLSSISDSAWYIDKIKDTLQIRFYDIDRINIGQANPESLQLYNFMPLSMLNIREPIIYFVDSFVSLMDNAIWWKMRSCKDDIVIDIHGNIVSALEISNRIC